MSGSALRSLTVAAKGKGPINLARRVGSIGSNYGAGAGRMERRLESVLEIVERHGCRATLPITAVAVQRNPRVVAALAERGIEFALHGLRHVDHRELGAPEQVEQFGTAKKIFEESGIPVVGFRAPYLRTTDATIHALRAQGFDYDSSRAIHWPIPPELVTDGYRRAIDFYDAANALEHPSLPTIEHGIVRIPCSIPDDEAAVDRLRLSAPQAIADLWLDVFRATHDRGELFTLAVHPERIERCGPGIEAVLDAARSSTNAVWIARLDEIARWWRARAEATVTLREVARGCWHADVLAPEGVVASARGAEVSRIGGEDPARVRFEVRTSERPVIGVHPASE